MHKKEWKDLTQQEKVEDLRKDIEKLFSVARDVDDRIAFIGQNLGRVERMVLEATKKLDILEKKSE